MTYMHADMENGTSCLSSQHHHRMPVLRRQSVVRNSPVLYITPQGCWHWQQKQRTQQLSCKVLEIWRCLGLGIAHCESVHNHSLGIFSFASLYVLFDMT
jgi:hypothetical protein